MSDQPSTATSLILRYAPPAYLIVSLLWRLLTPAHEYPGRFATYLDVTVDALMIVGLIAGRTNVPKALFWIALIAGVVLFAIRLNSPASWWTGHLVYTLPPR